MTDWTDRLAGARMQVDQQFEERVTDSQFSNQQWGLVMTAVEWEIHEPADPEAARLVADTTHLQDIIPELDRIQEQVGGGVDPHGSDGGGIAGSIKDLFGSLTGPGSDGNDRDKHREAEALVQDYARELQSFLESHGRWEDVRTAAAGAASEADDAE